MRWNSDEEINLYSETSVEVPVYAPFWRINIGSDGVLLRFFFVPPGGPKYMKLAASVFMGHRQAIELSRAIEQALTRMGEPLKQSRRGSKKGKLDSTKN